MYFMCFTKVIMIGNIFYISFIYITYILLKLLNVNNKYNKNIQMKYSAISFDS